MSETWMTPALFAAAVTGFAMICAAMINVAGQIITTRLMIKSQKAKQDASSAAPPKGKKKKN